MAAISFIILLPLTRIEFDRHHDGYMLAQAIAIHDGAVVHRDVFAQYGPVTPWLQSLALYLPLGPALAIRVLNAAFIALTIYLLADIGRNRATFSPITYSAGLFAATAWFVLSDVLIGVTMLPWPSTLAACVSVASLYFLIRALGYVNGDFHKRARIYALLSGALLGVLLFTKINVGAYTIIAMFIGLTVLEWKSKVFSQRLLPYVAAGSIIIFLGIFSYLQMCGAWDSYISQAVLWPLEWSGSGGSSLSQIIEFGKLLSPQALPVFLVGLVIAIQCKRRGKPTERFRPWLYTACTLLVGVFVILIENRSYFDTSQSIGYLLKPNTLFLQLTIFNYDYLNFFIALVIASIISIVLISLWRLLRHQMHLERFGYWLLLTGVAGAGAYTVIPRWDPRHVWWALPVGMLLLGTTLSKSRITWRISRNPLWLPIFAICFMAVFSTLGTLGHGPLRKGWDESPSTLITAGMLLSHDNLNAMVEDQRLINKYIGDGKLAVFLVPDGDLSVLSGKYQSIDAAFVDWGIEFDLQARLRNKPVVVAYGLNPATLPNTTKVALRDYELREMNGRLMIFIPKPS